MPRSTSKILPDARPSQSSTAPSWQMSTVPGMAVSPAGPGRCVEPDGFRTAVPTMTALLMAPSRRAARPVNPVQRRIVDGGGILRDPALRRGSRRRALDRAGHGSPVVVSFHERPSGMAETLSSRPIAQEARRAVGKPVRVVREDDTRPDVTGRPSAPTDVETIAWPLAIASKIFSRVPPRSSAERHKPRCVRDTASRRPRIP